MELKKWQKIGTLIFAVVALALIAIATSTTADLEGGVYATAWSLLPPILAIGLALITKEVYVSLFVGIFSGGLLAVGGLLHPLAAMEHSLGTIIESLADGWNIGILVFLVVLRRRRRRFAGASTSERPAQELGSAPPPTLVIAEATHSANAPETTQDVV